MSTFSFVGQSGAQNWTNLLSWGGAGTPGAVDTVLIESVTTFGLACLITGGSQAASSISIGRDNGLIASGGALAVGGQISVGNFSGTSAFNITGSANVTAGSVAVGAGVAGSGSVLVDGGTLTVASGIEIGKFAASSLRLTNGGSVSCNLLTIGNSANGTNGTLIIGGDVLSPATLSGTLNANTIALATASSKLLFNLTDSIMINGAVFGIGSVEVKGTGTVNLSGNNSYTGGTLVSGGTLALFGTATLANSSAVVIESGGQMDISALSGASTNMRTLTLNGSAEIRLGGKQLTITNASVDAGNGGFVVGSPSTDALQFNIDSADFSIANLGFNRWSDGDDSISIVGNGLANHITGSFHSDLIDGASGADLLDGGGGNDTLNGGFDNDMLVGGAGDDVMNGGAGDDSYFVESAGDVVSEAGGGGIDTVHVTTLSSYTLGAAFEHLTNETPIETFFGFGNNSANIMTGANGIDGLFGGAGNDTLNGGEGNDALVGGLGNDSANGGAGDDVILLDDYADPGRLTSSGNDVANGGANNDLLWGYGGNDTLNGDDGADALVGNDFGSSVAGVDVLNGGAGNDQLFVGSSGSANMNGGADNDSLFGGNGADTLRGGTGSDYLFGSGGADTFQFYRADLASGNSDIVYFVDAGDRLKFSADLNGSVILQDLPSLEYSPGLFTTGVYITANLGGGLTSTITVYGSTVAALTPMVDYTL